MDRAFVGHGSPCWFCRAPRIGFAVLNRGSWIANSWVANSWAMLCGVGLRVAVANGVIWCWVAATGFGNEETRMRDRDER